MAKRAVATKWELVCDADETGALVNLDYKCPYCRYDIFKMIFIGASNVDKIDGGFETDQVCDVCGKPGISRPYARSGPGAYYAQAQSRKYRLH
jgi:hypothetical protein